LVPKLLLKSTIRPLSPGLARNLQCTWIYLPLQKSQYLDTVLPFNKIRAVSAAAARRTQRAPFLPQQFSVCVIVVVVVVVVVIGGGGGGGIWPQELPRVLADLES
jgi:hypothetical protein